MIDQYAFVHFATRKEDRTYFFLAQLGVSYSEALEALEDIKNGIIEQQKAVEDAAAKLAAEKAAAESVQAELVQ